MLIAHLADLHLGFRAYHRSTARGINAREADVADAFRQALERVVELRPDLVLLAGDVFHTVRPSNAAIAQAFRLLSRLTERLPGVPVVMIAGNHDSPRSAETGNILTLFREIPNVRVVTERVERVPLPALNAAVLCVPHVALARQYAPEPEPLHLEPEPSVATNVLLLHGTVVGGAAEEKLRFVTEYGGATVHESAIRPPRWDYVALGHYHIVTELAPNMWYAGATERTSTNVWMEAEGPKGFVTFDTASRRAAFHPLETRAVLDLERIGAAGRTAAELDERIAGAVESIPGGIAGKIVRLVIQDIPRHLLRELSHRRIREYKAEALHFHLDARQPEVRRVAGGGAALRRQTLPEQVEGYLESEWRLTSSALDRARLVRLGKGYLEQVSEEGGEA